MTGRSVPVRRAFLQQVRDTVVAPPLAPAVVGVVRRLVGQHRQPVIEEIHRTQLVRLLLCHVGHDIEFSPGQNSPGGETPGTRARTATSGQEYDAEQERARSGLVMA